MCRYFITNFNRITPTTTSKRLKIDCIPFCEAKYNLSIECLLFFHFVNANELIFSCVCVRVCVSRYPPAIFSHFSFHFFFVFSHFLAIARSNPKCNLIISNKKRHSIQLSIDLLCAHYFYL